MHVIPEKMQSELLIIRILNNFSFLISAECDILMEVSCGTEFN